MVLNLAPKRFHRKSGLTSTASEKLLTAQLPSSTPKLTLKE
jgi:hypothetical protein